MTYYEYPKKAAKRHDCGSHGMLTAAQIAMRAGIANSSVKRRLVNGVSGEALCAPARRYRAPRRVEQYRGQEIHTSGHIGIAAAVMIARRYRDRAPSVQELRSDFGMSRATAYRWRNAFLDSLGLAA